MRAMAQMLHCVQHNKIILKAECCVSDGSGNPLSRYEAGQRLQRTARPCFLAGHALLQIIKIKKGKMMTHLTLCNKSNCIIL